MRWKERGMMNAEEMVQEIDNICHTSGIIPQIIPLICGNTISKVMNIHGEN